MIDFQEAKNARETLAQAADMYRKDRRFKMLIDSTVSDVICEHRLPETGNPCQLAQDVAMDVAAMILARIYHEDAEIREIRMERDYYKNQCLDILKVVPSKILAIPNPAKESTA